VLIMWRSAGLRLARTEEQGAKCVLLTRALMVDRYRGESVIV